MCKITVVIQRGQIDQLFEARAVDGISCDPNALSLGRTALTVHPLPPVGCRIEGKEVYVDSFLFSTLCL